MRLYLVRHGEAKPKEEDPERGLAPEGEADARRMAGFLRPLALRPADLWHSGKARARQTAEILGEAFGAAGAMEARDSLGPLDPVAPVADEINRRDDDLVIIGHMPFVGRLASLLLAGDEEADVVGFRTVAVACLDRDEEGTWRLAWHVSPDVVP